MGSMGVPTDQNAKPSNRRSSRAKAALYSEDHKMTAFETGTLDTAGAAEMLHVSNQMVQTLARNGDLPAMWLGGKWLFLKSDLTEWISAQAREQQRARKERVEAAKAVINAQPKPKRGRGRPRKAIARFCDAEPANCR